MEGLELAAKPDNYLIGIISIGDIMENPSIPFQTIDWKSVPRTEHKGETGTAYWQTMQFDGLRVRCVEYSKNYKADHWCEKGHIVYCLHGEVINELKNGTKSILRQGMSYIVSDDLSSHRSVTENGVKLLIIDGDFLKLKA
ncbi:MAG: hypothetical protein ACI8ZB_002698 [Desulforhopalus sp.]